MQVPSVPAVWTIAPEADRDEVDDLLERLAEQLEIDKPQIQGNSVMLPANYVTVAEALDEVEPGWRDESLIIPPEA